MSGLRCDRRNLKEEEFGWSIGLTGRQLAADGAGRGVLWARRAHRGPLSCTQIWDPVGGDGGQFLTALPLRTMRSTFLVKAIMSLF